MYRIKNSCISIGFYMALLATSLDSLSSQASVLCQSLWSIGGDDPSMIVHHLNQDSLIPAKNSKTKPRDPKLGYRDISIMCPKCDKVSKILAPICPEYRNQRDKKVFYAVGVFAAHDQKNILIVTYGSTLYDYQDHKFVMIDLDSGKSVDHFRAGGENDPTLPSISLGQRFYALTSDLQSQLLSSESGLIGRLVISHKMISDSTTDHSSLVSTDQVESIRIEHVTGKPWTHTPPKNRKIQNSNIVKIEEHADPSQTQ